MTFSTARAESVNAGKFLVVKIKKDLIHKGYQMPRSFRASRPTAAARLAPKMIRDKNPHRKTPEKLYYD